jgi:hypothetical protein
MADTYEDVQSQLREKISSKMTVATFLAGFTFAALLELLMDRTSFQPASVIPARIAVVSLTFALALFIAAVYMYDRLTTPRQYWKYEAGPTGRRTFLEKLHFKVHSEQGMLNEGALVTYMVGVWQWVFTPAVISAFVGFVAILYSTHDTVALYLGLAVILAVFFYYVVVRPILGIVD